MGAAAAPLAVGGMFRCRSAGLITVAVSPTGHCVICPRSGVSAGHSTIARLILRGVSRISAWKPTSHLPLLWVVYWRIVSSTVSELACDARADARACNFIMDRVPLHDGCSYCNMLDCRRWGDLTALVERFRSQ